MPKNVSEVWAQYTKFTKNNKKYGRCVHCDYELQANTARFKAHLVKQCNACPPAVVKLFLNDVKNGCFATKKWTLKVSRPNAQNSQDNPNPMPSTSSEEDVEPNSDEEPHAITLASTPHTPAVVNQGASGSGVNQGASCSGVNQGASGSEVNRGASVADLAVLASKHTPPFGPPARKQVWVILQKTYLFISHK